MYSKAKYILSNAGVQFIIGISFVEFNRMIPDKL